MAGNAYVYDDKSIREDLLDVITNISPKVTQLSSGFGTSTAKSYLHQWLTKELMAVKTNAYIDGVDASYAVQDTSRQTNHTQVIRQGYRVTGSDAAADRAGYADRMAEEQADAMATWKNDLELALLQGSLACGASGSAARTMKGIRHWIVATNVTNQSGISLSENTMLAYLERVWNYGAEVDEIYVGATLKKRIDGFTAGATKNISSEDKRLVNTVSVYESSFAPLVKIFLHRYANTETMCAANANSNMIFGIQNKYYRVAYFRKPYNQALAKTGDSDNAEIIGECCLEDLTGGKAGFIGEYHF